MKESLSEQLGKIHDIAGVFDTLTAERSYEKATSNFGALTLMKEKMISHFDK